MHNAMKLILNTSKDWQSFIYDVLEANEETLNFNMKHQIEKTTFTTKMIAWNKKQRLISNKQLKNLTNKHEN